MNSRQTRELLFHRWPTNVNLWVTGSPSAATVGDRHANAASRRRIQGTARQFMAPGLAVAGPRMGWHRNCFQSPMMHDRITIEVRRGSELIGEPAFAVDRKILIGRGTGADILLDSPDISRRHALLIPGKQDVSIHNVSANQLIVRGAPVGSGSRLPYGTAVQAGPFTLLLGRRDAENGLDLMRIRQVILDRLIENVAFDALDGPAETVRARVEAALERIACQVGVPPETNMEKLVQELADEALGLGPLEPLMKDGTVSEIMVICPDKIFVERRGRLEPTDLAFTSEKAVRTIIERIIAPLGRRIDESSAMVDARLPDGSRVNAVIPPLAIRGACITIRKFSDETLTIDDLIELDSLSPAMADMLCRAVAQRANIVISGGTGSGKTTLLGVLSSAIPESERIVTVEDAAELKLAQAHLVPLESRPPNAEGKGQVTIRDLVRNALRMRPDRIVVGECRGGEAIDMLQAMNTGHDGSLTTLHANSPAEAISRLETLCLMASLDLPARAIREQIASAIDLIVQQSRLGDGSRKIVSITEIDGLREDGTVGLREIFRYRCRGGGRQTGGFEATGYLPSCTGDGAIELGESRSGGAQ
jgi:pilus assembly protein CpaF